MYPESKDIKYRVIGLKFNSKEKYLLLEKLLWIKLFLQKTSAL